jgi:CDP-diacylglycerol--glycerol-3-phosphate 3-phosphatidyltransferase
MTGPLAVKDIYFSVGMAVLLGIVIVVYLVRAQLHGRARHERTEADGGSRFLNKASMEMGYWLLDPIVNALVAARVTPNQVTAFSLVPALMAAAAAAFGWFGLACVLATLGSLCDLVDGVLARRTGVASAAGEVLDAAVDRYVEYLYLAGIALYYRTHWEMLLLVQAAIFGSFMISYATAKAEAMGVTPPRGSMRRAERAVYVLVATGLTPFSRTLFADTPSHTLREFPIIFALALVAVVTNVSVVQRFGAIAEALRAKQGNHPSGNADGGEQIISDRETPARPV